MTRVSFELISEGNRPIAAILPMDVRGEDYTTIYRLLPAPAICHDDLAERWGVAAVLATNDWAREQLRRVPMTRPRGIKLELIHTTAA